MSGQEASMDNEAEILISEPDLIEEPPQEAQALVPINQELPRILPTIILDDLVPLPGPVMPVVLDTQSRRDAVLHARSNNGFFALVNRSSLELDEPEERLGRDVESALSIADAMLADPETTTSDAEPLLKEDGTGIRDPGEVTSLKLGDLCRVGVVARIVRVMQLPDERLSALVELGGRVQPVEILRREPFVVLRALYPSEVVGDTKTLEAVYRQVGTGLRRFFEQHPNVPEGLHKGSLRIKKPALLADFVGQHLSRNAQERISFLTELDLNQRMLKALEVTLRELDLLTVGNRISDEIREKIEKHQRDFFLREQMKSIRIELGEEKDPATLAVSELSEKLAQAHLPEHAQERADEEMNRLKMLPVESPEHNVIRSYLEWIACLPWSKQTQDHHDIVEAREILDEDHWGLKEVKERIIELLAVRRLKPQGQGTLLCLAGPPGVGKTSLGQSVARTLGRKFYRFSVGGMRDEAEIKGHRRTYVGALPGRVLQALKQVKTRNPLIMLDEIDKMGSDWRGDPSSAMLEVLDPAQNDTFLDHYLDLHFDLSQVMFIATANVKSEIPGPLLDRLEVIDLPGYIPDEKLEIAARYLVKRQRDQHGLTSKNFRIGKPALRRLIADYTHEAGVREAERLIGKLCRKRATAIAEEIDFPLPLKPENLQTYLGAPRILHERITRPLQPGVALGLAWTPMGGEVLFIEAVAVKGKGGSLKVTGHLGEVMTESASLALSYVRANVGNLGLLVGVFDEIDIHIHFPAGAVKKDGPSAGIAITSALLSLLKGRALKAKMAMTGEITLRGDVLAVGGIREKIVAAKRTGIKKILVPERNRADVEEMPKEVLAGISILFVEHYSQVMPVVFGEHHLRAPSRQGKKRLITLRPS
jgi:ATP-dependent Lon protease